MRALGKLYSIVADTMWVLTVIAFVFLLGIFPQVSIMTVPYYDGTVSQLLIMLMAPAGMLLVGFNLLSGRWPIAEHRKRNVWASRLSFWALVVIAVVVFLVNKGVTGLPVLTFENWTFDVDLLAKIGLFITMAFALIDTLYTKGDDYVATSLKTAADPSSASRTPAPIIAPAPHEEPAAAIEPGPESVSAPASPPARSAPLRIELIPVLMAMRSGRDELRSPPRSLESPQVAALAEPVVHPANPALGMEPLLVVSGTRGIAEALAGGGMHITAHFDESQRPKPVAPVAEPAPSADAQTAAPEPRAAIAEADHPAGDKA